MTTETIGLFPDQRVSTKKKRTDADWYVPTIDYIIDRAISENNKNEVKTNIDYANGIIDKDMYNYVSKKYGTDEVPLPADIRELDLITPIKERYIGEYIRQHSNYQVFNNDYDSIVLRNKDLAKQVESMLAQALMNFLNQEMETGVESKEVPDIEKFVEEFIENWMDERAIKATEKIKLLETLTDATVLYIQGFFYWWSTESVITYRTITNNDVVKEIVSPLEYYRIRGKSMFIEDDPMGMRLSYISITELVNQDRHILIEEDKNYIDKLYDIAKETADGRINVPIHLIENRKEFQYYNTRAAVPMTTSYSFADNTRRVPKYHIVFNSLTKVGYLTYWNEVGELDEMVVDETYKLNELGGDISVEWEWISEVFEAYRYGDKRTGLYVPPKPIDVQREKISNVSECKLPYNGITGILDDNIINPIPKRIAPLMALYRIYTLQQERFVAKYKGDLLPIPETIISDNDNFTRIERLNYILSDNYLFFDDTAVDPQILAYMRSIGNPGIERYIQTLSELRKHIKDEAWELANMNEQRFGDINPHAGKSTTEYAISKSTTGSILMFEMYNKFKERDYKADLDHANIAWIHGKAGSYYDKNTKKVVYVNIEPLEMYSDNIGIYFENSTLEEEKLQALRELAFSASQHGDYDIAADAIQSESSVFITSIIKKEVKARRELEQQMQMAEAQSKEEVAKAELADKREERQHTYGVEEMKKKYDLEIAYVKADTELIKQASSGNEIPDQYEKEYKDAMLRLKQRDLDIKSTGMALSAMNGMKKDTKK
jgi:hypothetical protein